MFSHIPGISSNSERIFPNLKPLTNDNWKITDTSHTMVMTQWTNGSSTGSTSGTVDKFSENASLTISGAIGAEETSAISGSLKASAGRSDSLETENTTLRR